MTTASIEALVASVTVLIGALAILARALGARIVARVALEAKQLTPDPEDADNPLAKIVRREIAPLEAIANENSEMLTLVTAEFDRLSSRVGKIEDAGGLERLH